MTSQAPIGIFDSGVGGLSVLHDIHRLLPHENITYIADSQHAPYGNRSTHFIQKRSLELTQALIDKGCKLIVVACNTATTEAIQHIRDQVDLPIIGVEPAIKPAARYSKNRKIGVLATQRTTDSKRIRELIELYADHCEVSLQACPGLVEIIESNDQPTNLHLLENYLQPLLEKDIDALVLGCTHYPFIREQIEQIIGNDITIHETGKPVAEQINRVMQQANLANKKTKIGTITIYSSSDSTDSHTTISKLWPNPAILKNLNEEEPKHD
ncbi:MAG: Glutamate racemase (EC [uncultured Thiotrichaceae bacterium]|uniref:Glutamate racemase n=1 Tax=uncultured Thiotrichaceae bacterium TaxID=298394 RepID=A0A6S6T307_9GAMM|nr:MAG: Glutamate racemase (EC [uncultured Thiotrichaceae bacterium]